MKNSRSSALDQFISHLYFAGTKGLRAIVFLIAVIVTGNAHASENTSNLSRADKIRIERMLTAELQQTVNEQRRVEGQSKIVAVKVKLDEDSSGITLVIDLGKGYIPRNARYFGAEMEELTGELATTASELVRDIIPIVGVVFLYEGKDIYEQLPDEHSFLIHGQREVSAAAAGGRRKIVVSAGHGIYYHHGFSDWRPQRDPSNAITEDFITPAYASELSSWLST